jgi:hypothetical protein
VEERLQYPDIRPLVSHPWTVITINPPPAKVEGKKAADLPEKVPTPMSFSDRVKPLDDPKTEAAWKGTVMPKDDDSYWLIGAFAPYERIVSLGKAIEKRDGAAAAAERVELAIFGYRSKSHAALLAEPDWRKAQQNDGILSRPTEAMLLLDRDRWAREQLGYGIATLHAMRQKAGAAAFDNVMDSFGKAHHRGTVSAAEFATELTRQTGNDAVLQINRDGRGVTAEKTIFSTRSFRDEPDDCLIVYGTLDDEAANRNTARALQELVRRQCLGVVVTIATDTSATDAQLNAKHLLLIGGPEANRVSARCAKGLPVQFANHTCSFNGETYAHPSTCILAACANPLNPRFSAVVLAGLSAASTNDAAEYLMNRSTPAAEVIVGAAYSRVRPMVVSR